MIDLGGLLRATRTMIVGLVRIVVAVTLMSMSGGMDQKQTLLEYLENRNELPCEHRAHICNPREVDGYSCRYCIENGNYPEYSKQEVKEAL